MAALFQPGRSYPFPGMRRQEAYLAFRAAEFYFARDMAGLTSRDRKQLMQHNYPAVQVIYILVIG